MVYKGRMKIWQDGKNNLADYIPQGLFTSIRKAKKELLDSAMELPTTNYITIWIMDVSNNIVYMKSLKGGNNEFQKKRSKFQAEEN